MKEYGIDIESPQGELNSSISQTNEHSSIDIEIPENMVLTDSGKVVEAEVIKKPEPIGADEYLKKQRRHMGIKAKSKISNGIIYFFLCCMTVIWLFPFVGLLFDSLRVETTGLVNYFIPKQWGFDNYINLFTNKSIQFGKWFLNTTLLGIFTATFQTLFILAMSYVLSRMRFKGRKGLMNFMLILGMFPGFLTMILLYNLLKMFDMIQGNAVYGLMLVYVASSGMGYYVSKGFFDTIPRSLDEAARVDGATRAQVMFKIILPMAKPIVIYTILMGFMAPWGDFVMAKYLARDAMGAYNVATGLQWMLSTPKNLGMYYTTFCAGGVVVALPVALLFMFLQKYYVAGVTGGAVKG